MRPRSNPDALLPAMMKVNKFAAQCFKACKNSPCKILHAAFTLPDRASFQTGRYSKSDQKLSDPWAAMKTLMQLDNECMLDQLGRLMML